MDQRDDSADEMNATAAAAAPPLSANSPLAAPEGVAVRLAAALLSPPLPLPPRLYINSAAALPTTIQTLSSEVLDRPPLPLTPRMYHGAGAARATALELNPSAAPAPSPPGPLAPRDYGWKRPQMMALEPSIIAIDPPHYQRDSGVPLVELIEPIAPFYVPPTHWAPQPPMPAPLVKPVAPRSLEFPVDVRRSEAPPRPAAAEPAAAPPTESWFDLARRFAKIAALVFASWMAAVLLLILVYRFVDPPLSSLMVQQRLSGQEIDQQWVAIEDVSPDVIRAVLLSEDSRFCEHSGIDFDELQNAIDRARDGNVRGASTISMQVIKNLFLWPSKSYVRKAIEIPLTYAMEAAWPKARIMEVYLNIAEWGPGIFGVEAASQHHFNKPASRLNEREAARLAVALPNPFLRDASDPGPRTRRLAADIQGRMRASSASQTACVVAGRTRTQPQKQNGNPPPDDDWDGIIRRAP